MASVGAHKIRVQDIRPYDAPSSLAELRGPYSGLVSLPPWVYWGPQGTFDLQSDEDVVTAYQALIQEGRTIDQIEILNADRLVAIWPELSMPVRVRRLWEGRFRDLCDSDVGPSVSVGRRGLTS